MARIKSSFVGVPPRDVIADASIYTRTLKRALGEVAAVYDRLTGENSEASTINHTGSGRGCPLGMPLVNQTIGVPIYLTDTGSAVEGPHYIIGCPIFRPEGESTQYEVEVDCSRHGTDSLYVEVRNSSWTLTTNPTPMTWDDSGSRQTRFNEESGESYVVLTEGSDTARLRLTLAAGLQYILVRRWCYTQSNDPGGFLTGWRVFPSRARTRSYAGPVTSSANGSNFPAHATLTTSTWVDFYDHQVFDEGPLDAYVLTRANRNINALWEYLTGDKVGGNNAYQCSTTRDHDGALFTAEPVLDFPLMCLATGGAVHDSAGLKPAVSPMSTAPTDGLLGWSRYPTTQTGTLSVARARVQVPSFLSSADLKMTVLVQACNPPDVLTTWEARINASAGSTSWAAFTQIGTSSYWTATASAGVVTPSSSTFVNLQMQNTGGGALSLEAAVLGVCFYYEAP